MAAPNLRVGSPAYVVARPLDLGLEHEPEIELTRAVPADLVPGLRDGSLDVALVSSIELFRQPDYGFLDGLAITGRNDVRSVQVFLRQPLNELRRVVLDPASRAAQALTRVVLPARCDQPPEFVEIERGADPQLAARELDADGWLAIGDAALRTALSPAAPDAFSPSAAWAADTGLPFVFAVWIVRAGVELTAAQRRAFVRAHDRGQAALSDLALEASRSWDLPPEPCLAYLQKECEYAPAAETWPALEAFRDRAAALGLCLADVTPQRIALD